MNRTCCMLAALGAALSCTKAPQEPDSGPSMTGVVAEADTPAIGDDSRLAQSVGLETLGGEFTPLLESGSAVPCETRRVFSTADDNQDQITVTLYRGTGRLVGDNVLIGRFRISGFPKAARGVPSIELRVMAAGRDLQILATDAVTGRACRIDRVE